MTTRKPPPSDDDPSDQDGPGVDDDVPDKEPIDESPLEAGEERPERDRKDPNTYPDPDNPPRTP